MNIEHVSGQIFHNESFSAVDTAAESALLCQLHVANDISTSFMASFGFGEIQ